MLRIPLAVVFSCSKFQCVLVRTVYRIGATHNHPLQDILGHRLALFHELPPLLHHRLQQRLQAPSVRLAPCDGRCETQWDDHRAQPFGEPLDLLGSQGAVVREVDSRVQVRIMSTIFGPDEEVA